MKRHTFDPYGLSGRRLLRETHDLDIDTNRSVTRPGRTNMLSDVYDTIERTISAVLSLGNVDCGHIPRAITFS